jgi:transposase
MSLHPQPSDSVPEETKRVAYAAFPKGNLYLTLRDQLSTFCKDEDFAALFSPYGQPAEAPWRLALICIFQFLENLSDRQAADAVRSRIDWKYVLAFPLDDSGFHVSVLGKFRARLLAGSAEMHLVDLLLEHLKAQKLLKPRGQQRTDSPHIIAAVRSLNRLECVGETLRAALNALATHAPDWLGSIAPLEWFDRYSSRIEESRLPKGEEARRDYGNLIGADGSRLLTALFEDASLAP